MVGETSERGTVHYYIGENDCKKATCNLKQEFPRAECPYCIFHAVEDFFSEESSADTATEQPGSSDVH